MNAGRDWPTASTTAQFIHTTHVQKTARRANYAIVVPAVSRRVWRRTGAAGVVNDVLLMGESRLLLDLQQEGTWDASDILGAELKWLTPQEPEEPPTAHSTTDVPTSAAVWTEPAEERVQAGRPVERAIVVRDPERASLHLRDTSSAPNPSKGAAGVEFDTARLPLWTMGTIALCPIVIALILIATAINLVPWPAAVGFGLMLLSLLGTAILQLRQIYLSSHRTRGRRLVYLNNHALGT